MLELLRKVGLHSQWLFRNKTRAASPATSSTGELMIRRLRRQPHGATPRGWIAAGVGVLIIVIAAIQAVIQQANSEQVQALASGNPALMSDTATAAYYRQLVQTNQGLAAQGATSIELTQ